MRAHQMHCQSDYEQQGGYGKERFMATAPAQLMCPGHDQGQTRDYEQHVHQGMGYQPRKWGRHSDNRGQQRQPAAHYHMKAYQSIGRTA